MSQPIKYILGLLIAGVTFYNSIYIQPLSEKLANETVVAFDANKFVQNFWTKDLIPSFQSATNFTTLFDQLKKDPKNTFDKEGQSLGIGNIEYFKVQGEGTVSKVNENNVMLQVDDQVVEIETEFIFGNAIRDASGLIKINDYDQTADFNSISESINDKIRKEVIPNFKNTIQTGDRVAFQGAIELNKAYLNLNQPEIIPIHLEIKN